MEKTFPPRAGRRLRRKYLKLSIPLLRSSLKLPRRKDTLQMGRPFQRQKTIETSESTCFLDVIICFLLEGPRA